MTMEKSMKMVTKGNLDWLEKELKKQKYSLKELTEEWIRQFGKPVNAKKIFEDNLKRNIYRWIDRLQKEHMDIEIASENGKYYIVGHVYDADNIVAHSEKLIELLEKYPDIQNRILFDVIPSENQYLDEILNAISKNLVIKFDYKKYSDKDSKNPEIKEREVHPYCVKRFENRWYVIGLCVKSGKAKVNELRTYSLDMIVKFKHTNKEFPPDPSFNAAGYFGNVYGITTGDNRPITEIRIRATARRANYLRTLPLHPSQKEVGESTSYYVFQYKLRPAMDFYQALLHLGPDVEVLSPESVRDDLRKLIQEMADKYKTCTDCKEKNILR